jgi:hypothetical protein
MDQRTVIDRQKQQIKVLERRNELLRDEVERLTMGRPPRWTKFEESPNAVFGDGRAISHHPGGYRVFLNSRYQVAIYDRQQGDYPGLYITHLSIKRRDGAAVHDWRDLQRIKNELVGPEAEGVELYPAESRLVDGANQYHLYVVQGGKWPIGFTSRLVSEEGGGGVQQRPWPEGERPEDCKAISMADMVKFAGLED